MSNQLDQKSATEQLMLLKELTKTTGILHNAQVFQLTCWGYLISPKVDHCYLNVDIENKKIVYDLKLKGKATTVPKTACKIVAIWVKALLGEDWSMTVKHGTKKLYHGR